MRETFSSAIWFIPAISSADPFPREKVDVEMEGTLGVIAGLEEVNV